MTALIATQGVDAGAREVPRWLARTAATLTGWLPRPPVTRTAIALVGGEVTVDDAKARRELGYIGKVTREAGLAECARSAGPCARRAGASEHYGIRADSADPRCRGPQIATLQICSSLHTPISGVPHRRSMRPGSKFSLAHARTRACHALSTSQVNHGQPARLGPACSS